MSDDKEREARSRHGGASSIDEAIEALDASLLRLRSQLEGLKGPSPGSAQPDRVPGSDGPRQDESALRSAEAPRDELEADAEQPDGSKISEPAGSDSAASRPRPAAGATAVRDAVLERARALARELLVALEEFALASEDLERGSGAGEAPSAESGTHGGLPQLARTAAAPAGRAETIEAGPFGTVAALHDFERRLDRLPYLEDVHLRLLSGGWATFDLRVGASLRVEDELPYVLDPGAHCVRDPDGRIVVELPAGHPGRGGRP